MKLNIRIIITVIALATAVLACNYPMPGRDVDQGAQPPTSDGIPDLQEELNQAAEELQSTGRVRLVIDEQELTSFLVSELDSQTNPRLENPQVFLRDGQMRVSGDIIQGGLRADLDLVLEISVTADGKPYYEVASATFGGLPLPQTILEDLTQRIDSMFQAQISPKIQNILIEDITISDGEMIIVGHSIM